VLSGSFLFRPEQNNVSRISRDLSGALNSTPCGCYRPFSRGYSIDKLALFPLAVLTHDFVFFFTGHIP